MLELSTMGLPGRLIWRIGSAADYRKLARFHYVAGPPASFALICAVDLEIDCWSRRTVAVGVLSHPCLNCAERQRAMNLGQVPAPWRWSYLNRHLRTISRLIVHPQFRGIGVSVAVARLLLAQSPTRYVESISRLATHHPLFEKAGMRRINPLDRNCAYFLYDRMGNNSALQLSLETGCAAP